MSNAEEKLSLIRRAMFAYLGALGIPVSVLVVSFAKHAGWKPVLVGLPVYLVIFGSITYQFVKDLHALKLKNVIDTLSDLLRQAGMTEHAAKLAAIVSTKTSGREMASRLRQALTAIADDDAVSVDLRQSILSIRHKWS